MNVALVKTEIANAVRNAVIDKLDCYNHSPAAPSIPAFTIGAVTIEPNNTFGPNGSDVAEFTCTVLAASADDKDGQARLDAYLSRSGANSIRAALLAARGAPGQLALNGAADDVMIVRIDGYRMVTYSADGGTYYGADITVRVIGS